MKRDKKQNRNIINWLLIFGAWTLAALFMISFQSLMSSGARATPLGKLTLIHMGSTYSWLALTPLILWLSRKFPVGSKNFYRNLIIHIVCCVSIVHLQMVFDAWWFLTLGFPQSRPFASFTEVFNFLFVTQLPWNISIYCTVLGIIFGTDYYRKFREGELQAVQLEARLSQARMHVLKMQLHPHFLFNTHNAISELIYKDPEAAERMLGNLSDLLRLSLDHLEVEKIPLKQELDFLEKYLQIEQTRFHDRLRVKFDIAPETLDAIVPNMILQPLVENAIKHGIAPIARGGTIEVHASREKDKLYLQVIDDGLGLPFDDPSEIAEGIGLSNTRARLKYLYGDDDHSFEIKPNDGSGLKINLTIPFHSVETEDNREI